MGIWQRQKIHIYENFQIKPSQNAVVKNISRQQTVEIRNRKYEENYYM